MATDYPINEALLDKLFGVQPQVFRNTEMIYSNQIAQQVADLGYSGMLTEAVDKYLCSRPKTSVYRSNSTPSLPLLLKHASLSDDIAFRFSQKSWSSWPLTAEKYLAWLNTYSSQENIGLFMDFETFGEHQWESTGIFAFFTQLIAKGAGERQLYFITPSDELVPLLSKAKRRNWLHSLPVYSVDTPISWADENRDLSAWRSNALQEDTLKHIYSLEQKILAKKDIQLLTDWRRLQTSDHFYCGGGADLGPRTRARHHPHPHQPDDRPRRNPLA